MTWALEFFSSESCARLVTTLLHSLWQGVLLAGILYMMLRALPGRRADLRYALSLGALSGVVMCALVTWSVLSYKPQAAPITLNSARAERATADASASAASTVDDVTPPSSAAAGRHAKWFGLLGAAWLIGVAAMLVRACLSVRGARGLGRCAVPVNDPSALRIFEALRSSLVPARRVTFAVCDALGSPAVLGVFRSAVLAPAAMLSGLSPDELRAVLAHELAHVRRYDYLVNLAQMLVEAMGFFNPAVWWISRRVRVEREAACDAVAAQATGHPHALASALASWAARSAEGVPRAAAALSAPGDGGLLERVRRLASPGHRPALRVSWGSLGVVLVASAVVLVVLSRGAALAVDTAAKILTPEERMKHLEEITGARGPLVGGPDAKENQVTVSGWIRTDEGGPLPKDTTVTIRSDYPSSGYTMGITVGREGRFSTAIQFGEITIWVQAEGYAPVFAGPLVAKAGGKLENVELVLERGFPGRVKVVNAAGAPVPDAKLDAGYLFGGSTSANQSATTDDAGVATFWHCAEAPVQLDVNCDGYQFDRVETKLADGKPFTWTLRAARPATGTVVSEATGQPVAGATIKALHRRGFAESSFGGPFEEYTPTLATTDDKGRFQLRTLRDGCDYTIFVTAKGHGCRFIDDVRAGAKDMDVWLGPEIHVYGKVIGPLDALGRPGERFISYTDTYSVVGGSRNSYTHAAPVEEREGAGYFHIDKVWAGKLVINAGGKQVILDVQKPVDDLVIDLAAHQVAEDKRKMRAVVLKLAVPKGAPAVKGTATAFFVQKDPAGPPGLNLNKDVDIRDGEVRLDVAAPGNLLVRCRNTIGYWFKEVWQDIPAGDEPLVIELPCIPAGVLYGQVLEADGTPARLAGGNNVMISLVTIKTPVNAQGSYPFNDVVEREAGEFLFTPLPLDGTHVIVAHRGASYALSEATTVDEAHPSPKVQVRMVEGVTVPVQVLGPGGAPPAGVEVTLEYNTSYGAGFSGAPAATDGEGRVSFGHVNSDIPGTYWLRIPSHRDYRPVSVKLDPKAGPVTLRLERGAVLTGRVIDDATGKPLADAEVYAFSQAGAVAGLLEAEEKTNEKGEFRFSNLGPGRHNVHVRQMTDAAECSGVAGQKEAVELRVKPPAR